MTAAKTLGRYELICEVAKGQLGPLWAAHATGTDGAPAVLIRRVSTAAPTTPDEVDALFEGAWWMLEVQDPSIARGIDVVKTEGELGVVTEYAEGEVLRSVLRLASFKRKPVPVGVGLRIALDVLEALEQANVQSAPLSNGSTSFVAGGLVPDSVLVGRDGRSRLLDVGVLGPASRVSPIARHPEMASYAAPEQLDDPNKSDMRTNVYAVGVMVWEMLSGKRLFVGSTHQAVSEKVKAGDIARLDSQKPVGGDAITSEVADAIAKAVSTDPAERYASAKEMQDALSAAATVASHADVAQLLEDLAGNTLASRRKLVEKALQAKPAAAAKPAAPTPAVAPKPAAKPAAPPPRKATLVGIHPPAEAAAFIAGLQKPDASKIEPPPRPPLESLDSEELESISRVEVIPFGTEEAPTRPAAKEAQALAESVKADGKSPKPPAAEPIKTQLLGTPAPDAATAIKAAEDETVTRVASPFDSVASLDASKGGSPKPPDVKAPGEVEEVPISLDLTPEPPFRPGSKPEIKKLDEKKAEVEAAPLSVKPVPVVAAGVGKPEVKPELGSKPDAAAKPAASAPEAGKAEEEPKPDAKDAEKKKDESAVAWVGPPPGVALDADADRGSQGEIEEPLPSIVPERTQKLRKFVALGIGGLVGLIALGIAISRIGKKEDSPEVPSSTPAVSAKPPVEEPKKEEPKAEEPKKEEPKAEEPKAEEPKAEEPKKEEPKAEEPAPKPTTTKPAVTKPAVTKPTTTTTTKPTTTKPKTTKPKPKYTPSGI